VRRFYFDIYSDIEVRDEEGVELPNEATALQGAAAAARDMAAASVRDGRLVLHHRIVVRDQTGREVGTIYFRDVIRVEA
jgi:hypothetical protein